MTPADAVARAKTCIGHRVAYILGQGGMKTDAPFPWVTPETGCDCSGFANWCLARSRADAAGIWWSTDQICADALHEQSHFAPVAWKDAAPGDLVVYPHQSEGHYGHVGIVSLTGLLGPSAVIHCSHGNWRVLGDAVAETPSALWSNPLLKGSIVARYKGFTAPTPPVA